MSAATEAETTPRNKREAPSRRPAFTFTDGGCRWELRLGALLSLAACFLWQWLGAEYAGYLLMAGLPLVALGVPIQAWQSRSGRPGYPLKLGLILAVMGAIMSYDLRYREVVDDGLAVQVAGPVLLAVGLYVLALWPLARFGRRSAGEAADGS